MILHIDTSDSAKTTIALKNGKKSIELSETTGKHKSQNVLPLIEKLLKKEDIALDKLTAIEVHVGPGSFTGLRVGVAVANTIAWVLNIPVNGKKQPVIPIYSKSKFDY